MAGDRNVCVKLNMYLVCFDNLLLQPHWRLLKYRCDANSLRGFVSTVDARASMQCVRLRAPLLTIIVKPVVKRVWQPVECLYTRYNRLSYRLDNRLYRVNGASQTLSSVVLSSAVLNCCMRDHTRWSLLTLNSWTTLPKISFEKGMQQVNDLEHHLRSSNTVLFDRPKLLNTNFSLNLKVCDTQCFYSGILENFCGQTVGWIKKKLGTEV